MTIGGRAFGVLKWFKTPEEIVARLLNVRGDRGMASQRLERSWHPFPFLSLGVPRGPFPFPILPYKRMYFLQRNDMKHKIFALKSLCVALFVRTLGVRPRFDRSVRFLGCEARGV